MPWHASVSRSILSTEQFRRYEIAPMPHRCGTGLRAPSNVAYIMRTRKPLTRNPVCQGLSVAEGVETPESTRICAALYDREDPGAITDMEKCTWNLTLLLDVAVKVCAGASPCTSQLGFWIRSRNPYYHQKRCPVALLDSSARWHSWCRYADNSHFQQQTFRGKKSNEAIGFGTFFTDFRSGKKAIS